MKKTFLFMSLIFITPYLQAQLEWAGLISSDNRSITNAVAVDNNDNVIAVGEFRGTTDFDFSSSTNNLTSQGAKDMFISKYDQNGNLIWVISMGGVNNEEISDVATDNNNNIYVTGRFQSPTIDMDPSSGTSNITSTSSSNHYDIFVAKYDANGNHIWSFAYGSNNLAEAGNGIDVDNNGHVYLTGVFRGSIDIDPSSNTATLTPNGSSDTFVAKYTDNGNYVWGFNLGASNYYSDGKSIKSDENGNIYVGGRFEGNVDFDPGSSTNIVNGNTFSPDGFLAKYSENMDFLWVVNYSNNNQNRVNTIDVDYTSGDVIVGGYFQGNVDFNPNGAAYNVNTTGSNGFIARYFANSGELDWLRHIEGSADPIALSIDQTGTIWTSGFFSSTVDFDYPNNQDLVASGFANMFVGQYDITNGDFICVYDFGNNNYNESRGIDNLANNEAVFSGNFEGSIDFDPGTGTNVLTSSGGYNSALVKINATCPIATPLNASISASSLQICEGDTITFTDNSSGSVTSWQWTFNGGNISSANTQGPHEVIFNNSGNYNIELEIGDGNIIDTEIISITVNAPVTATDIQIACDSYTWIDGNTYTSDNNTATDTIFGGAANGCDSIVTLDLTINNAVIGTDTQTACDSYTWIDGSTYTSNNNTATHTFTGGAANGCDSIVTLDLTINNTVTGTDTQTACESFTWIDGNTYTSSNNTATHTIISGAANGCDSIVTLDLTINNVVTATDIQIACDSFTWIDGNTYTFDTNTPTDTIFGGAANGCDSIVTLDLTINNAVTGTDTQIACGSYTWIDGNTYISDNNTATYTISGGAANGCDSIVTLDLTIQTLPAINASTNSPVCEGKTLTFDVTTVNGGSYHWSGPNGFTSQDQNPTINATTVNHAGTYQVVVSLGNNCADTAEINVTVNPAPIVVGTIKDDNCSSNAGQIEVNVTSPNPPFTYLWSNKNEGNPLTNLSEGTYEVTVTDASSCSSAKSFQVFNIKDDCGCFVYVANAFSPNGDGNNDFIPVRGKCVTHLSFKIFNRWGNLVYETQELNDGWDGYYKGDLQNTGVFVYTLEATFENGETVKESGDINLIR